MAKPDEPDQSGPAQASPAERDDEPAYRSDPDYELLETDLVWKLEDNLKGNTIPSSSANPDPFEPSFTSLTRTPSLSSSLHQLVGDKDSISSDEDWDAIQEDDFSQTDGNRDRNNSVQRKKHSSEGKGKQYEQGDRVSRVSRATQEHKKREVGPLVAEAADMDSGDEHGGDDWQQAGHAADAQDLAGVGIHGRLDCTVTKPQKENEGTQNQFISFLVTTNVCI